MEFSQFHWHKFDHYDKIPATNENAHYICSLLSYDHSSPKFYFKFFLRNIGYEPEFAPGPGNNDIIQFSNSLNWETTLEVFDSWLKLIRERVQQSS